MIPSMSPKARLASFASLVTAAWLAGLPLSGLAAPKSAPAARPVAAKPVAATHKGREGVASPRAASVRAPAASGRAPTDARQMTVAKSSASAGRMTLAVLRPGTDRQQGGAARASVRNMKAALDARFSSAAAKGSRMMVKASFVPRAVESAPARVSIGQAIGLHQVEDPLELRSSVAMVIDQQSGQPLYQKNADAVLPIASITKVMTAMVVLDAGLPTDEVLEINEADRDTERFSGSRLPIGSRLTRAELLQLALMSSENRAASALGRHYPGGLRAFVTAMNAKARAIGMADSQFAEPTGLSSNNISNARDLARMVRAAHGYPLIRQYSTATDLTVDLGSRQVSFRSTNRLIVSSDWDIGLQKTGYISEAGKCLVMQAKVDSRPVIMVLLDAAGSQSRFADAQRLRRWLTEHPTPAPTEPSAQRADSRS